jgi:hypothetical protein
MTTVATTPEAEGHRMGLPLPHATPTYRAAYSYLLALLTGEARMRETKAIASTAVCEAHRRGLEDSRRSWHWRDDGRPVDVAILRPAA